MFLIKILGNHKTGDLNLEIRYKDIVEVMNNIDKVDTILDALEHVNQPITLELSSTLQLACRYALTTKIPLHLLELGANPNYLDANGCDAYNYVDDNENEEIRAKLKELLNKYNGLYKKEDKQARKQVGWDFLLQEQLKYYYRILK